MPAKVASRPKKSPAAAKPDTESAANTVTIDFPYEGESVFPGHYAIRISAETGDDVEVSVDGGAWEGCRESIGFYWFDWWGDHSGQHTIRARARAGKGRWAESEPRTFKVATGSSN